MKRIILILIFCFLMASTSWATNRYFSQSTGNDTGNDCTNSSNPCQSVSKANSTLQNGDVGYFLKGDVWSFNTIKITAAGSTWIGDEWGSGKNAEFRATTNDYTFIRISASNVHLKGFNINGDSHDINGIIADTSSEGANGNISNTTIENCEVHHNFVPGHNNFYYGILIGAAGGHTNHNMRVINCHVHHCMHECIPIYPSGPSDVVSNALIRGCEIDHDDQGHTGYPGLILLKDHITNAVIEFNYFHDSGGNFGDIATDSYGASYGPATGIVVRYNVFRSTVGAFNSMPNGQTFEIEFYGNIFIGLGGNLVKTDGGHNHANSIYKFYNNTFYSIGNSASAAMSIAGSGSFQVHTKNNIFYTDDHRAINDTVGKIGSNHNNNLFYRTSGASDTHVTIQSSNYNRTTVKSTWETSCQNTDPTFKNTSNLPTGFSGIYETSMMPNNDGLSIQSTSPARDNGIAISGAGYNGAINFAGTNSGEIRPQGAAWDIGAYEFSDSNDSPPSPPANVRLILP
jgi:hypothetical protein